MDKRPGPLGHHLLNGYLAWFYENQISPINVRFTASFSPNPMIRSRAGDDGTIILNLSQSAVRDLVVDSEGISFKARFDGVEQHLYFHLDALLAIDIPVGENGKVCFSIPNWDSLNFMLFGTKPPEPETKTVLVEKKEEKPFLKVVK